jgi:hypothetical protein
MEVGAAGEVPVPWTAAGSFSAIGFVPRGRWYREGAEASGKEPAGRYEAPWGRGFEAWEGGGDAAVVAAVSDVADVVADVVAGAGLSNDVGMWTEHAGNSSGSYVAATANAHG